MTAGPAPSRPGSPSRPPRSPRPGSRHTTGSRSPCPRSPAGASWRVVTYRQTFLSPSGGTTTGTLIAAADVTSVYRTVDALARIDMIVSAIVIVALAVVGAAIVRSSLRPLTDIEHTAEAIAAGDLSRRVPDRDPRTEVGRLGRSLNTMLAQIETAFHAREDSEAAARRSEERMRQFVADASHELRTPLTAIRGYAEYYRQRGGLGLGGAANGSREPDAAPARHSGPLTEPDMDRIMERVEQESARMGVLVEDMLLLARLDQQRPIERRPVDLLTLTADAVQDARMIAPRRTIELTVGSRRGVPGPRRRGTAAAGHRQPDEQRPHPHPGRHADRRADHGRPGPTAIRQCAARSWRSPTRAPGWARSRPSGSSSGSTGPTRPGGARPAVPGWAWPSWPPWSPPTAGRSAWTRPPAGAPPSGSRSRWPPRQPRTAAARLPLVH